AYTLAGEPVAERSIQAGLTRTDGRGTSHADLESIEEDARQNRRGCVWQNGEPQGDLASPSINLRTNDKRDLPQPPRAGAADPFSVNNLLLGLINISDFARPTIVLAQAATPTPTPPALPPN